MEEKNYQNNQVQEPKYFKVSRVLGFCFIPVAILGIVFLAVGFGGNTSLFVLGSIFTSLGLFLTIAFLMFGFLPKISKANVKLSRYIQQENRADLTDISTAQADIQSEGFKKAARAVKEGLKDVKYCQECGTEIDENANFCSKCGAKQN